MNRNRAQIKRIDIRCSVDRRETQTFVTHAALFYYHEYAGSPIVQTEQTLSGMGPPDWSHAAEWREEPDLETLASLAKAALMVLLRRRPSLKTKWGRF